jgi:molybdenum cofactor biosynthesis protein B
VQLPFDVLADVIIRVVSVHQHKHGAPQSLKLGVITASDTRTQETDQSGRLIRDLLQTAGHRVAHYEIVADDRLRICDAITTNLPALDGIIITGGTGIAARDVTVEAVRSLIDRELEGFGELFRMLSYQEIGSAAIMSRATAGVSRGKILVAVPGSPAACKLALEKLLLPELGHIAALLRGN